MKTIKLALITFLLAMIFGCQENMINEPDTAKFQKDIPPAKQSLKICCEVRDPIYGVCNLNGCVNYTLEINKTAMNPIAIPMLRIKLYLNAVLCDRLGMAHLEWRAEGKSDDTVYVSEDGILLIEKCYSITNRSDVVLLVKYLVTTNGIGISSVNLTPLER